MDVKLRNRVGQAAWMVLGACLGLPGIAATVCKADDAKTYPGRHVNVVCNFDDPSVGKAAVETAEAAWDKAAELLGVKSPPLKERRKLYLYDTITAYEDAERSLTNGRYASNLAFSIHSPRESHVVVQPVMSAAVRKRVGLPEMTRRLIVHEIAHLCRYEYSENRKLHPRWYADGVAFAVEAALIDGPARVKASTDPPFVGRFILDGKDFVKQGEMPELKGVFSDQFGKLNDVQKYSVTYLVAGFLNQDSPGWVAKYAKEDRGQKPGDAYADHMGEFALKLLGGKADAVDARFKKFVEVMQCDWHERYRSLEQRPKGWVQLAFADANSMAWRNSAVQPPFVIEGKAEFLPSETQQMNVLLEGNDAGFISVAMTAGFGVQVFRFNKRSGDWTKTGEAKVAAVKAGKPYSFKVRNNKNNIIVEIEGKKVVDVKRESSASPGEWGLGMQAGGAGIWHNVKFSVPGSDKGKAGKADSTDDKPAKGKSMKETPKDGKKGA